MQQNDGLSPTAIGVSQPGRSTGTSRPGWRSVASRARAGAAPPQHGLSSDTMVLITSDCGAMRSLGIKMVRITSDCAPVAQHALRGTNPWEYCRRVEL